MEEIRDDLKAVGTDVAKIKDNLFRLEGEVVLLLEVLPADDSSDHMQTLDLDLSVLRSSLQESANNVEKSLTRLEGNQTGTAAR